MDNAGFKREFKYFGAIAAAGALVLAATVFAAGRATAPEPEPQASTCPPDYPVGPVKTADGNILCKKAPAVNQ